jgi:RNA polymerase sigma factor (sigma-70 family)
VSLAADNVRLAYWVASRLRAPDPDALRSEALLGLVEAEARHDPARGRFASLAFVICRQRAFDELRRQRLRAARETSLYVVNVKGEEDERADLPHAAPADGAGVMAETLRAAVAALPVREAEVLRLRYGLDGEPLTLRQAGALLGLSAAGSASLNGWRSAGSGGR